jgi:hypothetical protein
VGIPGACIDDESAKNPAERDPHTDSSAFKVLAGVERRNYPPGIGAFFQGYGDYTQIIH